MICGSGLPYQMASVPHMTLCAPDPAEQLPDGVGGLVGRGEQLAPQRGHVDPHVVVRRDRVAIESAASRVSMPMVAFGVVGSLDLRWVPRGVVDDELHVRELAATPATMSSGWLKVGSKFTSGRPLWATKTLTPEVVRVLDGGEPDGGSSNEYP